MLYQKQTQLKNKYIIFMFKNKKLEKIDKSKTIEELGIKDGNIITIIIESNEITVKIQSTNQKINEYYKIKRTDKFSVLENILIQKYNNLKSQNLCFYTNGNLIDKSKTIEESKIKDQTVILLIMIESNEITVKIKSTDQKINEDFKIQNTDNFNLLENKLIQKYNTLKNQNLYFFVNANLIDKSRTINENRIKDGNVIMIIIEQNNDNKNNTNKNNSNKIISVIIMPIDQSFIHLFKIKKTDQFTTLANKLYQKETSLKNKNHYFLANGRKIDTSKTIESNDIKDQDTILVNYLDSTINLNNLSRIEKKRIFFTIKSNDSIFSHDFICEKKDKFDKVKKELYKIESGLNDKDYYFSLKGIEIDISKTIEENNIKNNDVIFIIKKITFDDILSKSIEDEPISVTIKSYNQSFVYTFKCKNNDKFSELEEQLYKKEPQIKNERHYFTLNNRKIDISKKIGQIGIINNDTIIFINDEPMAVIIMDYEQRIKFPLICNNSELLSKLEEKLYKKQPKYKDENHKFYLNNQELDISKTIKENNITKDCIIYYKKIEEEKEEEPISVLIEPTDQSFLYPLICKKTDKFTELEKKLFKKLPDLKNK